MNDVTILHVLITFSTIISCLSYSHGPPATDHVCKEMFPEGHHVDSQMKTTPYEIDLSQNIYTPWDTMDVSVKVTKPDEYFRGFFLQVRRADCTHPFQYEPLGAFTFNSAYSFFVKTQDCFNNSMSAVSHKTNTSLTKAVMQWTAPAAKIGHLYFVATIVKEQDIFWTDVRSEIVTQSGLDDQVYEYCPLKKLINPPRINTTPKPTVKTTTSKTTTTTSGSPKTSLASYVITIFVVMISLMTASIM